MTAKSRITSVFSSGRAFFHDLREKRRRTQNIYVGGSNHLTAEKQVELEHLCKELFKCKDLITSGKLQLLGLEKIRKRLGKRWYELSRLVHDTVDEVLKAHTDKNDLYFRYQEENYLVVFCTASPEEAQVKIAMIASDIRQRLFKLNEKELRDLEIHGAARILRADVLANHEFPDFLSMYASDGEELPDFIRHELPAHAEEDSLAPPAGVVVDAEDCMPESTLDEMEGPTDIAYKYLPLWDVKRNALTTYLCEAVDKSPGAPSSAYTNDNKHAARQLALDIKILRKAMETLVTIERDGIKVLITCPVQYQTLHNFESYAHYKAVMENIPQQHYQFLVFHVVDTEENLPIKDTYWFAKPLRQYCRHVFAEVPLRRDLNFNYLHNTGVDVVGIQLERLTEPEQEIIRMLNNFCARAKSLKIPHSFVLGIDTLSMATSCVCAGFDFIGGKAVHDRVPKPDIVHKYTYGNLISSLMPPKE